MAAVFKASSGMINALLAVRLLGVEDYGHMATLLSFFVLYLSLNSSIFTVLVAKLIALDNNDAVDRTSRLLASAVMFSGASVALLISVTFLLWRFAPLLLSLGEFGDAFDADIRVAILMMGVLTAIQIVTALQSAIIESAGRLDLAMKWQLIGSTIVLVVLSLSFIAMLPLTASGYIMVLCAGSLIDLCFLWFVRRNVAPSVFLYRSSYNRLDDLLNLLKSGGLLQGALLMNMFLEPLNKFLLNHFVGAFAVTVYDLAMKVIWGINYLFSAGMRVFLHLGSQGRASVGQIFSRVITLIGVPVVILHAIGALFLSWIAHHWMAIDSAQLMTFFAIATVSNLGMIYVTPLYISLIGRGDFRFIFQSHLIVAVTNSAISFTLIPYIGLIGAAFGLLSATIYNVAAIYVRCKNNSETFSGLRDALSGQVIRYTLSLFLFGLAILLGLNGGDSFLSLLSMLGVLILLAAIMANEPMANFIFERIRPGK